MAVAYAGLVKIAQACGIELHDPQADEGETNIDLENPGAVPPRWG